MFGDPFKLIGRTLFACAKIIGYTFVFFGQSIWYLIHGEPVRVGEAIGHLGRGIVDTFMEIFKGD